MTARARYELEDIDRREFEMLCDEADELAELNHAAFLAAEAAFVETPHCERACSEAPAFVHTAACDAAVQAELDAWWARADARRVAMAVAA
jgi:hypothetical protein